MAQKKQNQTNPFVGGTNPFGNNGIPMPGMSFNTSQQQTLPPIINNDNHIYCDATPNFMEPTQQPSPECLLNTLDHEELSLTETEKYLARWNFQELDSSNPMAASSLAVDVKDVREERLKIKYINEEFNLKKSNPDEIERILNELQNFIYGLRLMEKHPENRRFSYLIGQISISFEIIKKALVPLYELLSRVQNNNLGYNKKESVDIRPLSKMVQERREEIRAKEKLISEKEDEISAIIAKRKLGDLVSLIKQIQISKEKEEEDVNLQQKLVDDTNVEEIAMAMPRYTPTEKRKKPRTRK